MVRLPFSWDFFRSDDSRANKLDDYLVMESRDSQSSTRWLFLNASADVFDQFNLCGMGCLEAQVPDEWRKQGYNHALQYPYGVPAEIVGLADLLKEHLTLRTRMHVDFALALDWYTVPQEGVDSKEWSRSPDGELMYRSKYSTNPAVYTDARTQLLARLLHVIEVHPLLRAVPLVVSVPGHQGDGTSFGERLARKVAGDTGKRVTAARSDKQHVESKSGSKHQYGDFHIDDEINGEVLIVDDVYRSGMSMGVAAKAAKDAGAERVFGLVVARTLRN